MRVHKINNWGANKMVNCINQKFFKINSNIIRETGNNCETCKRSEPLKKQFQWSILRQKSLERYQIDLINFIGFSDVNDGYKHVLNIIDDHSFSIWLRMWKTKTAEEVVATLNIVCMRYGYSKILQFDNKKFCNVVMVNFLKKIRFTKKFSSSTSSVDG